MRRHYVLLKIISSVTSPFLFFLYLVDAEIRLRRMDGEEEAQYLRPCV